MEKDKIFIDQIYEKIETLKHNYKITMDSEIQKMIKREEDFVKKLQEILENMSSNPDALKEYAKNLYTKIQALRNKSPKTLSDEYELLDLVRLFYELFVYLFNKSGDKNSLIITKCKENEDKMLQQIDSFSSQPST